jgi:hypothetical protein
MMGGNGTSKQVSDTLSHGHLFGEKKKTSSQEVLVSSYTQCINFANDKGNLFIVN